MIGIIDYGLGNVRAFANIYASLDIAHRIVTQPADLQGITRAILPGVGAFDQAMQRLQRSGMRERLDELVLQRGLPVLGVCVGMQILAARSDEGHEAGLGWIDADVVRFRAPSDNPPLRVPHMGWNTVEVRRGGGLFAQLDVGSEFYFLHSYLVRCGREDDVVALTSYGTQFACALSHGNIHGVQFHPEKSHQYGIQLLRNFAELPC